MVSKGIFPEPCCPCPSKQEQEHNNPHHRRRDDGPNDKRDTIFYTCEILTRAILTGTPIHQIIVPLSENKNNKGILQFLTAELLLL